MFRQLISTVNLIVISFVILSHYCWCQEKGLFEDDFEYLDDYDGSQIDDFTINRDTDCTQYCYSAGDKCCGYSTSLWGSLCSYGKAQSPINLPGCKSDNPNPTLTIDGDFYKGSQFSLTNDGHAVVLRFLNKKTVTISPGGGTYILDNIRFHWGENETVGGSEHCVKRESGGGCVREAMELQLIHYRAEVKDLDAAIESGKKNAVLVISFLLRTATGKSEVEGGDSTPLPVLNPVLKQLENVATFGDSTDVKNSFDLSPWFSVPNLMVSSYFGSLTTPKCKQVVKWYVIQTPMTIKAQDVPPFRSIKQVNGEPLLRNRRPMQKRNKREVQCYQLKVKNIPATSEIRDPLTGDKIIVT